LLGRFAAGYTVSDSRALRAALITMTMSSLEAPGNDGLTPEAVPQPLGMVPVVRTELKMLAHLLLESPASSNKELGAALGVSAGAISHWRKSAEYQRFENWLLRKHVESLPPALRTIREQVEEKFQDFAGYMQDRLLHILDTSEDPKIQVDVAHDWLDRAGFAPVKKQMSGVFSLNLTADAVKELQRREFEAGLIDVSLGP